MNYSNKIIAVIALVSWIQSPSKCIPRDSQLLAQHNSTTLRNGTDSEKESELHAETCESPSEEFVSPVRGSPRCCRKCEAGMGMLRLCTDSEDTKCRPCDPGSEFSPVPSATAKCQQCRRCQDLHPLARTRTACTPTTNTECECEPGYYMSAANQTCKPCSQCKPNEGVVRSCQWNSDTQCQACPSGFWSAMTPDSVKCVPCSTCSDEQILVRECSISSDAICCPKSNENCTGPDMSDYDHAATYQLDDSDASTGDVIRQNQMLPIYCSIMGMIIISLLLYVVYKLWKQREAMRDAKLSDVYSGGVNGGDKILIHPPVVASSIPVQSPGSGGGGGAYDVALLFPGGPCAPTDDRMQLAHSKHQSMSSAIGKRKRNSPQRTPGDEKHPLIGNSYCAAYDRDYYEQSMKILPKSLMGEICYCLAQNGWRELAIASGFGQTKMEHLDQLTHKEKGNLSSTEVELLQAAPEVVSAKRQVLADQSNPSDDTITQAVHVISKLLERDNMTVSEFHRALVQAGRSDLTGLLAASDSATVPQHANSLSESLAEVSGNSVTTAS